MGSAYLTLGGASAPCIDQGVRDGTSAFGPSDLTTSADDSRPARICIVEDDPVMLRMVADYLEQHNMHAVPATGRQEMIRYFTANEPDLVILDLRLGHEDGFDRSIDVQILRLRRKLETDPSAPSIIRTERGVGYVFALPVERF